MENITTSNKQTNGNTIKLIKMVKAWKYNCNVPIKSLEIELSSIDFLSTYEHRDKTSVYYDWMVRDYFKYLLTIMLTVKCIPGTSEILLYGSSWETKVNTALSRAEKACKYESNNLYDTASDEWKLIFGDRFPKPSEV